MGSRVDVYLKGKDPTKVSPDLTLCNSDYKGPWETSDSRLLVVLDTTKGYLGTGFNLTYRFYTCKLTVPVILYIIYTHKIRIRILY